MIVVDASTVVFALADDGDAGRRARAALAGHTLHAPELLDLEVTSAWRSSVRAGALAASRALAALGDLVRTPIRRHPHLPLVGRGWRMRDNLTTYDAAYVALAEALEAPLVTFDARLGRAPGTRCPIQVLR